MMSDHTDVLIIGAGVAGLAAAWRLSTTDLKICLLEARDRIGGRIYTLHPPTLSTAIELGAEFIHGRPPELFEIIGHMGLAVAETGGERWCARNGNLAPCREIERVELDLDQILSRAPGPDAPDISFQQLLDSYFADERFAGARAAAIRYIEGYHAARADRLSVQALVHGERASDLIDGHRSFRLPAGYDAIANYFRTAFNGSVDLRLNTIVKTIEWQAGQVRVTAQNALDATPQVFRARAAIITLPLGVLKAQPESPGAVRFIPEIPEKRAAMSKIEVGQVIRVNLHFRHRWWTSLRSTDDGRWAARIDRMSFLFAREEKLPTWWTQYPAQTPVMIGWHGGRGAEILLAEDCPITDLAIDSLAHAFNVERCLIEDQIEAIYRHDWHADPFARGSYSYIGVGGLSALTELARPVANTLFFAGEATNTEGHEATVHGAVQTGLRAARDLLERLRN
jgi:monoamine oxidase